MEDRFLSFEEIATHLGINRDTVYRWLTEKRMPAHRIGRLWKFCKEEVVDWVEAGGGLPHTISGLIKQKELKLAKAE